MGSCTPVDRISACQSDVLTYPPTDICWGSGMVCGRETYSGLTTSRDVINEQITLVDRVCHANDVRSDTCKPLVRIIACVLCYAAEEGELLSR